ncbi:MAG: SDR family NAD(P)-dependent oxidoreductase [Desulfurivibrio sp.]|nr:SDR family NAD(P)-dependent oxidoreductase [Desulfurivibrio sp.]
MLSPRAVVIRDGERLEVDAADVVPGDILIVGAGDRVAADSRLVQASGFRTQEAALTGESEPVDKTTQAVAADAELAYRRSMAFAGTLAVEGEATGLVVATATDTEIGRIFRMLAEVETLQTPLLRQLDRSARVLAGTIIAATENQQFTGALMRIVITGGSRGIGEATALAVAENHNDICITYQNDAKAARQVAEKTGAKIVRLDVTDNSSLAEFKEVLREWAPEVLVNNAGVARWQVFHQHSFEDIEAILRVNTEGAIKVAKVGVDLGISRIINIASGAAKHPHDNLPVYCASKAALRMLTMAVGAPLICVNPGMTRTRMTNYQGGDPETVAAVIRDVAYGTKGEFGGEVDVAKQ